MVAKNKERKKQKGLASIETVIMVFIFVALLGSTLGFYGVTQRMILHSIASRAYGFELIRNRININYLRDVGGGNKNSYHITQQRYFSIQDSAATDSVFQAAKMPIDFRRAGSRDPTAASNPDAHNSLAYGDINRSRRNGRHYFESVWVKVGHGICVTVRCGE